MPKLFDRKWDRMEEYRLEQAPPLDDSEEPENEDTMMDFLAYMNERTGVGRARIATAFGLAMTGGKELRYG